MVEIEEEGLFLIKGGEVTHIHSSASKQDLDSLWSYLEEWDLNDD